MKTAIFKIHSVIIFTTFHLILMPSKFDHNQTHLKPNPTSLLIDTRAARPSFWSETYTLLSLYFGYNQGTLHALLSNRKHTPLFNITICMPLKETIPKSFQRRLFDQL